MASYDTPESIPDIIKDLDCIQETKQFSVNIEHSWPIHNIFELINSKQPGYKFESEQFSYTPTSCSTQSVPNIVDIKPRPPLPELNNSTPLPIRNQLLTDYFLSHSQWRLEISKSENDSDSLSVSLQLAHSIQPIDQEKELNFLTDFNLNLTMKLRFYLFNSELTDIFARNKSVEIDLSLDKFFNSLTKTVNCSTKTILVEQFISDKFCKIKNLFEWLNTNKSDDFNLICEIKFYNDRKQLTLPASSCQLLLAHKHAWTIRNWKDFVLFSDSTSHTFMNESDIKSLFSDSSSTASFDRFRSKLFSLSYEQHQLHTLEDFQASKYIEDLLSHVKWRLQLYPAGYSNEYAQSLSLFLNLSSLTGDLAAFSHSNSKKKLPTNLRQNNAKTLEEAFYDHSPHQGLNLLIKSPGHKLNTSILAGNLNILDNNLRSKELNSLSETFVKASFQISILNSDGHKVDKCQSERQLFELFGSWGYKEYMLAKDIKEQTTLHLHCKIILFYSVTNLTRPNLEPNTDHTASSVSHTKSNDSINFLPEPLMSKSINKKRSTKSYKPTLIECNSILHDLRRIYSKCELTDLIIRSPFNLDNTMILKESKAHQLILSIRSEVFEKMLSQQDQALHKTIDILDFDSCTVSSFLKYIYTDQVEITDGSIVELFKMADKYSVHRLREVCESRLVRQVSINTCVELLIVADLHNSSRLKKRCFNVLAGDVATVIAQPEWIYLETNYPSLLAEAFRVLYFKKNKTP